MTESQLTLIKEAMRAQGVRQTELAQRIGTSQAALSQILNGIRKPGPELLGRIHSALATTPAPFEQSLQLATPLRTCPFMSLKVVRAALSARALAKRFIESLIIALIVRSVI